VFQSPQKNESGNVPPLRVPNQALRRREYLSPSELDKLIAAAKCSLSGDRNSTMVLVAFRHGLRASELVGLRWKQIDLKAGLLYVRRAKQGIPGTHPIFGDELRALRRLRREQAFVFVSDRGKPFTPAGFAKIVERAGDVAKLGFKVHPAMLRHSCGFKLASEGRESSEVQTFLGHKYKQSAAQYTKRKTIWSSKTAVASKKRGAQVR
jgi:integrase